MTICKDMYCGFNGRYVIVNKHGKVVAGFDSLARAKAAYPNATIGPDWESE